MIDWKRIFLIFLCWFVLLNVINKASSLVLSDKTSYEVPNNIQLNHRFWVLPWLNFDGRNYLEIVVNGYKSKMQHNDLRVFFPLYPLLITVLSFNKLLNPIIIGLTISLASFLLSLYVFNVLMIQDKTPKQMRLKTLILLLLFPTSFYFISYYTESLFFCFLILFFYFLNKNKIGLASIFTGLATGTRLVGLALLPSLILEAYILYKKNKKLPFSIILAPLGYLLFSFYTQITSGNGFLIISQHRQWDRRINIFGIFIALKDGFEKLIFKSVLSTNNPIIYSVEVIELVLAISLIFVLIFSFRKIRTDYWLYMFFSSIMIFSTSTLISLPRLILPMFPIYMYLSKQLKGRNFYLICLIFFVGLIYLTSLFLRGYWVA